jgi:hypothetical protein
MTQEEFTRSVPADFILTYFHAEEVDEILSKFAHTIEINARANSDYYWGYSEELTEIYFGNHADAKRVVIQGITNVHGAIRTIPKRVDQVKSMVDQFGGQTEFPNRKENNERLTFMNQILHS